MTMKRLLILLIIAFVSCNHPTNKPSKCNCIDSLKEERKIKVNQKKDDDFFEDLLMYEMISS